jgi:hypothetical protein
MRSALKAFLTAAVRPPTALSRAIVAVLWIKLFVVVAMLVYFHFGDQHVVADAAAISRLLGPAPLQ